MRRRSTSYRICSARCKTQSGEMKNVNEGAKRLTEGACRSSSGLPPQGAHSPCESGVAPPPPIYFISFFGLNPVHYMLGSLLNPMSYAVC